VLDFESLAYALAIGVATSPGNTQPLDWSNLSAEKVAADILKSSCNIQMLRSMKETGDTFDPQRPILNLYYFSRVLMAYNAEALIKMQPYEVRPDGTTWRLGSYHCVETAKRVYIRMHNNRYEGCGYFQESVSPLGDIQASNTISAISKIDIEPIISTGMSIDPLPVKSAAGPAAVDEEPVESMVEYIRELADDYMTFMKVLSFSAEVLGISRNQLLRPNLDKFIAKHSELMDIANAITTDVGKGFTGADRVDFTKKWEELAKHELDQDIKQKDNKDDKQEGTENDDAEQEHLLRDSASSMTTDLKIGQICRESTDLLPFIQKICCWSDVLDFSKNKIMKSTTDRLFSDVARLTKTVFAFSAAIYSVATDVEKTALRARWQDQVKRDQVKQDQVKQDQDRRLQQRATERKQAKGVKQREEGHAKQRDAENVEENPLKDKKRGQDKDVEEEDNHAADQKEREDAERKEREKANTIITAYAEQDRYDSCSDSDEE
jgi:hypothetical protein